MTPEQYAMSMLHVPYLWGGKSPLTGLDCSGFVCEVLKAFGRIAPHEDFSAQELYNKFVLIQRSTTFGNLVFYGKSIEEIDHVGISFDTRLLIEAASGDHTTINLDIAKKQDARVKIRPIHYRSDFIDYLSI